MVNCETYKLALWPSRNKDKTISVDIDNNDISLDIIPACQTTGINNQAGVGTTAVFHCVASRNTRVRNPVTNNWMEKLLRQARNIVLAT